ncbi:c-type cytochrome [Rhodobium gokarnense]|uniref:Cytochrome c556 n=1 Tax=Rhodobium gokarnense TaxID=364296 RepID=A0ABT3HDJ1_9HYPH|nr:cytochrome c [Rhodobium gokarnense]MCW2308475.1 cytochrome c556 [Rhodobium gokarnense]
MKPLRTALMAGALTMVAATSALAISEDIKTRQSLMQSMRDAAKVAGAMAKGKMDYDPARAQLAMNVFYAAITGFPQFFGDDDSADPDTEAGPKIWQDMDGFKAKAMGMRADAASAIKTADDGFDEFKAAFGSVAENCKSCHDAYRVEKK